METIYIIMLTILMGLSIVGLVTGVSNDAVNFLTSAFGSKAASLRTIFTVASIGVIIGAVFSTGMMEIPRSGIFHPEFFSFKDVMIIYMAVMLANILLLDFFNTLGLPTSTSVSIVFELLGAAACLVFIKTYFKEISYDDFMAYLNTSKVFEIIAGIFLSVGIAFTLGAIIQYLSRLIFTFHYAKKMRYVGGVFGGVSLTALTYFILVNGLGNLSFVPDEVKQFQNTHTFLIIAGLLIFWTIVSQVIIQVIKRDILRIIILVGTFSLALAFAGNDLVNFIGVPLASLDGYNLWHEAYLNTGVTPENFIMDGLAQPAPHTSTIYLFIAGILMVLTLWFSKKARTVIETGVNLSRQSDDGKEKFKSTRASRSIVRYSLFFINAAGVLLPEKTRLKLEAKFQKTDEMLNDKRIDAPAFDKVRASVNLVVAAILISIGTNMKLPLSTTYVTFMVAMGTSLSDRAWDRESAVFRVAGVLNVIGGWFVTAFAAFFGAVVFAVALWFGGIYATVLLSLLAIGVLVRSAVLHARKTKAEQAQRLFNQNDIITINEITNETAEHVSRVIGDIDNRFDKIVDHLGYQDLSKLKKDRKKYKKIEDELELLKDNVFTLIKSLDEDSVKASEFYILFLDYLEHMVEAVGNMAQSSYTHVNNNHKNLKFNQIRDLKKMGREMNVLFDDTIKVFTERDFGRINPVIQKHSKLQDDISELIQKQVKRIRNTDESRKNTKLYFGLLLETKDLLHATMRLLALFDSFYDEAKYKL